MTDPRDRVVSAARKIADHSAVSKVAPLLWAELQLALDAIPADASERLPDGANTCCDNDNFGDGHECQKADASARGDGWRPIDYASPPDGELLLYFPEVNKGGRNHHIPMVRIGYVSLYPYRPPSHYMPIPPAPGEKK